MKEHERAVDLHHLYTIVYMAFHQPVVQIPIFTKATNKKNRLRRLGVRKLTSVATWISISTFMASPFSATSAICSATKASICNDM